MHGGASRPMRPQAFVFGFMSVLVALSGCSGANEADVDATLLPGQGPPLIFEIILDWDDGELDEFDPEQHVHLQVAGNTLTPSNVVGNPENDYHHQEFGVHFTADRGQEMTLVVTVDGDDREFDFGADGERDA